MRRFLVLALLLAVSIPVAAGYPDHYIGDQLPDGTVLEVEAWLSDFHDREPWGMRDPTGAFFLFGTLTVTEGVAVLEFDTFASRRCQPSIFNPTIEECFAWRSGVQGYYERHVLAFDGDSAGGVYVASVKNGAAFLFEALTVDLEAETITFTIGAWRWVPPFWYEDSDDYTRSTYTIRERETPIRGQVRNGSKRVSPQ